MKKLKRLFITLVAVLMVLTYAPAKVRADGANTSWYNDTNTEFILNDADDLAGLATLVNNGNDFSGKTIKLGANIDLSSYDNWIPIGNVANSYLFKGIFDGNNKKISNLTINGGQLSYAGLFSKTGYGATIKDLTIENPTINGGKEMVGALAGQIYASTIQNVKVNGSIQISSYHAVGGLAGGSSYSTVSNCEVDGGNKTNSSIVGNYDPNVEDGDNVGGLIGMFGPSDPAAGKESQAVSYSSVKNLTLKGWRKVGGLYGQSYNRESSYDVSVNNIDIICLANTTFATAKEETMGFGGMVGIFAPVSGSSYRYAENSYLEGTVSNVNISCANNEVNSLTKMGIISGGQRGSTDFVNPTDTQFNVTVSGTNSTTSPKESSNTTSIYTAYTAPLNYVAQIGANKYESLAEAIAAVPTTGAATTITMLTDSVESNRITIASTKNVVLDLNGNSVSYSENASSKTVYFITNNGTLTVQDTSANADGSLVFTATPGSQSWSYETVVVYNQGTFTLASGTILNNSSLGLAYAVNNSSNSWDQYIVATFNMTGGAISAPNGDAALRIYQNCAASTNQNYTCENYVNISGGTIVDNGIFYDSNLYTTGWNLTNYEGANINTVVNITGGTINGLIDLKVRHPFNTSFNFSGGTFTNAKLRVRKVEWNSNIAEPSNYLVNITGGKWGFTSDANSAFNTSSAWTTTSSWSNYKPYYVSGGVFSVNLNEYEGIVLPEGKIGVENTDSETKDDYPYTVGVARTYVAQIGNVQYETLDAAVAAANDGDTIELLANISVSDPIMIGKSIILDGKGYTITSSTTRGIRVNEGNIEVTIKNLEIKGGSNFERAIQVDSDKDNVTLSINNVTATATYYTINICGNVDDLVLDVTDSNITGYGAVNLWGNNGTVTIDGSTLVGINKAGYNAEGWNDFGVVIMEGDTTGETTEHSSAYNVTITNSTIKADSTNGNKQFAVLHNNPSANNNVTLENCSIELANENAIFFFEEAVNPVTKIKGTYLKNTTTLPTLPDGYLYLDVENGYKQIVKEVASVTSGDVTTKYGSLQAAVNAADAGDAVNLLVDVTLTSRVDVDKSLTIDLNNNTIYPTATCANHSAFNILSGADVVITNGTIEASALTEGETDPITVRSGASLELSDMTININSQNGACVYAFDGGHVDIVSGTYTNTTTTPYQYKPTWTGITVNQANVDTKLIEIVGGTFVGVNPASGDDSGLVDTFVAEGYESVGGDGVWTVSSVYAAQIDNVKYLTLAEAINDAEDGDTIEILRDIELTNPEADSNGAVFTIDKSITINGNNYTITVSGSGKYVMCLYDSTEARTLNINNLNLVTTGYQVAFMATNDYQDVANLNNVNITCDGECIYANCFTTINAVDCVFTHDGIYATGKDAVYYSALIVGYGGTINANNCQVNSFGNGAATFPSGGTITLTNTDIAVNQSTSTEENAGYALWARNEDYTNYPEYCRDSVITFNSGNVKGELKITDKYTSGDKNIYDATIAIKGGRFDNDPSEYVVEGFEAVQLTYDNIGYLPTTYLGWYEVGEKSATAIHKTDTTENYDATYTATKTVTSTDDDRELSTDTSIVVNVKTVTGGVGIDNNINQYNVASIIPSTIDAGNTDGNELNVSIDIISDNLGIDYTGAIPTVTFEVHPLATITDHNGYEVGKYVVSNDQLGANPSFTIRLTVPAEILTLNSTPHKVKVTHISSDADYGNTVGIYEVKGNATDGYYVDVTVNNFSQFELEETDIAELGTAKVRANLSLQDEIKVNFKVLNLSDDPSRYSVSYKFKDNDTITKQLSEADFISNGEYKFVVASCSAKEMTEIVNFVLYYDDVSIFEIDYSIRDYCVGKIDTNSDTKLVSLCRSILDYGAYAQFYFNNYKIDDLANAGGYGNSSLPSIDSDYNVLNTTGLISTEISKVKANLTLVSNTELNFKLTFEDESKVGNINVTSSGNEAVDFTTTWEGNTLIVKIRGIAAKYLDHAYTLAFYYGGEPNSIVYSPLSYAYANQNRDDDLGSLCKSLFQYWLSASSYLN